MRIRFALLSIMLLLLIGVPASFSQPPDNTNLKITKTNPRAALLKSAFVPGLGQFYNGKTFKGFVIGGGESYLIVKILRDWSEMSRHKRNFQRTTGPTNRIVQSFSPLPFSVIDKTTPDPSYRSREFQNYLHVRDERNIKIWILAATVFYSMFDAYVDAQLSDFNQTDKAYQVYLAPANDDGVQLMVNINF